jgi:hypothetical protein
MSDLSINVDENTAGSLAFLTFTVLSYYPILPRPSRKKPEDKDRQRVKIYGKKETADRRPFGLLVSGAGEGPGGKL